MKFRIDSQPEIQQKTYSPIEIGEYGRSQYPVDKKQFLSSKATAEMTLEEAQSQTGSVASIIPGRFRFHRGSQEIKELSITVHG